MNKSEISARMRELDAETQRLDATIHNRQLEIGETLLDAEWESNPSSRVQNQLSTAQRLRHELDDLKITRNRLDEAQRRKDEIDKERKELNRRISKEMSEVEPHFEEIGRLAFDVYRNNPVVDSSAEEIFSHLLERFNQIKNADRDVARLEDERKRGRNPVGQLVKGSKLVLERSRQQLRKSGMSSLYSAAGKEVCTSGLIDRLDDPKLHEAGERFFEARRHIETAEAKLQELSQEEENLDMERTTLLNGKGVNERRAELMTMQRNREHELEHALKDLGRSYAVAKSRPRVTPSVSETVEELEKLYEGRKTLERKRKRLDAALGVVDLDQEREDKEAQIQRLQEERDRLDQRIEELRQEIADEEERRKRLVKTRGKVEDLLE